MTPVTHKHAANKSWQVNYLVGSDRELLHFKASGNADRVL